MLPSKPSTSNTINFINSPSAATIAINNGGEQTTNQHNNDSTQKQSLAEAAAEIQQLLNQLDQSYPTEVPPETQEDINVAVRNIAKNPALSQRVVSGLKAAGMEALKELADNAYVSILLAAWEAWQNAKP